MFPRATRGAFRLYGGEPGEVTRHAAIRAGLATRRSPRPSWPVGSGRSSTSRCWTWVSPTSTRRAACPAPFLRRRGPEGYVVVGAEILARVHSTPRSGYACAWRRRARPSGCGGECQFPVPTAASAAIRSVAPRSPRCHCLDKHLERPSWLGDGWLCGSASQQIKMLACPRCEPALPMTAAQSKDLMPTAECRTRRDQALWSPDVFGEFGEGHRRSDRCEGLIVPVPEHLDHVVVSRGS
jgi:hypothetical protein